MPELSKGNIEPFLSAGCWAQAMLDFAKVTSLAVAGVALLTALLLWTARRIHARTVKKLDDLPQIRQHFPFQQQWIWKKACSQPDCPAGFSTMVFGVIAGFHNIFKKYGRHLLYIGFTPFLVLHKAQYVEEVLSSNKILTKGHQYLLLHNWLGTGLLTSTGDKWRSRRRLFTPSFHFRILEDFMSTINSESMALATKLAKLSRANKKFDVVPLITLCTLDIICDKEDCINSPAERYARELTVVADVYSELKVRHILRGITWNVTSNQDASMGELFVERIFRPILQVDFIYRLTPMGREAAKCLDTLHSFTRKVIAERKQELRKEVDSGLVRIDEDDAGVGLKKARPFMDLLLLEHFKNNISEEGIREEVDTFMFEGHDTTAMGISWALFLIGHHSNEQQLIHDELDLIFGDDRERHVTSEDLKQMKYLECALKECQRIYPSVPLITRACMEPFTVGGTTLPKGSIIQIATYFLHRDPTVFPKPEEFHPERFLPENAKGRHPYAYVPFSAGPRNCIGQRFALAEEKIVVANILRRFRVESLDQRDQVALVSEMVLRPRSGLRIKFTPR